jgi:hypothetical protein
LFIYGRANLAMEGKSVVPMEITYMDTEDEYIYMLLKIHIFKVHIFKLHMLYLKITKIYIFKSIEVSDFFLGLALFLLLRKAEREHWLNIPPTIEHQPDRIVTLYFNTMFSHFEISYPFKTNSTFYKQ